MSIDSITQLIYSCVDLILHLFIVCIYWAAYHLLCACIVWPTVLLRWLGRCCWHFFVVFIAIVRRAKQKGREILWLVSWTTVPFLPNRMCFSKKKKHSVLSVHSYCVLIVCMCFTKPVHSQTRKPTCSHPSSKIAHSLKTNIINCDSLKQKQKKMASSSYIPTSTAHLNGLHLWLIHTPTAVATICHVVFKCLGFLWGFSLGSDQERNRLNGT